MKDCRLLQIRQPCLFLSFYHVLISWCRICVFSPWHGLGVNDLHRIREFGMRLQWDLHLWRRSWAVGLHWFLNLIQPLYSMDQSVSLHLNWWCKVLLNSFAYSFLVYLNFIHRMINCSIPLLNVFLDLRNRVICFSRDFLYLLFNLIVNMLILINTLWANSWPCNRLILRFFHFSYSHVSHLLN